MIYTKSTIYTFLFIFVLMAIPGLVKVNIKRLSTGVP